MNKSLTVYELILFGDFRVRKMAKIWQFSGEFGEFRVQKVQNGHKMDWLKWLL